MFTKSALQSPQAFSNKTEILLTNQEAKIFRGVIRRKVFKALDNHIDPSQFGDGFGGANCELATLLIQALVMAGATIKMTVVRVYVDVVQAYASIVASLSIPLDGNLEAAMGAVAGMRLQQRLYPTDY